MFFAATWVKIKIQKFNQFLDRFIINKKATNPELFFKNLRQ
jgi:hypothetical protein